MALEELVTLLARARAGGTPSCTNNLSSGERRCSQASDPRRKRFIWTEGGGVFAREIPGGPKPEI